MIFFKKETLDLMLEDINTAISNLDSLANLTVTYDNERGIFDYETGKYTNKA